MACQTADIASFLSSANPNWKRDALQSMLNQHLTLTTREAVNRIKGNWHPCSDHAA